MARLAIGPCNECKFVNDNIELTEESWPGPNDGTYWSCAPGQKCELCGKTLIVFLEHPILELPARIAVPAIVE